jgi:hypothetical protein
MTPFILLFISLIFILPYSSAKMRGKVYGMGGSSAATRRRRHEEDKKKHNIMHNIMLDERKKNPIITIWQSDFLDARPNNNDFCVNLNSTWFHGYRHSGDKMNLSTEDLQKIKDMYIQQVYTPYTFPNTWRDPNEWRDANGNALQLRDISEEEIKEYYFDRCPQPPVTMGDVFSFIGTVATAFSLIILTAFSVIVLISFLA